MFDWVQIFFKTIQDAGKLRNFLYKTPFNRRRPRLQDAVKSIKNLYKTRLVFATLRYMETMDAQIRITCSQFNLFILTYFKLLVDPSLIISNATA